MIVTCEGRLIRLIGLREFRKPHGQYDQHHRYGEEEDDGHNDYADDGDDGDNVDRMILRFSCCS